MKSPALQRREALVLAGLFGAAGLSLAAVRHFQPVGRELELTPVVTAALAEPGPEAGNPRGDVTFLVFTDFNCAACRIAHPPMLEAVEEDGRVRLRFLDWPIFGADSRAAARMAIAADAQGLYLPVHTSLMQGGRADAAAAEKAIAAAGGDVELLYRRLASAGAVIDAALVRNARHAFALGLGGTPGHLIDRVLVRGAVSRREFARAIRQARNLSA
ncbi:thioredoxin domain-containing protein [Sandaracinobacteroides hominis]|uniref:thioredoxin domain-containing protein n=1 Tax=Sandaracinobacteroides hominis TaxID=2780086 RepID=UPI0018F3B85C|nr:thioredoxin domain-containing protein [Sandaracinobacteroides hominis]